MTTNITDLYGINKNIDTGRWKSQTFTSSGTFYVPDGVEVVRIVMSGGGGGGGFWDMPGGMGGDSIFHAPITVTAKGGWGAGRIDVNSSTENLATGWGGSGGGVSGGEVMTSHPTGIISTTGNGLILKLNTGMVYTSITYYYYNSYSGYSAYYGGVFPGAVYGDQNYSYTVSKLVKTHGGLGISSGNSVSGGGGAAAGRRGGAVVGFGKSGYSGGWTPQDTDSAQYGPGGGGGASFGDGGKGCGRPAVNATPVAAQNGIYGSGGGGGAYVLPRSTYNFMGGGGGGGGEIVIRDVPVKDYTAIPVTIGSGGWGATSKSAEYSYATSYAAGSGGNGICQIFWS